MTVAGARTFPAIAERGTHRSVPHPPRVLGQREVLGMVPSGFGGTSQVKPQEPHVIGVPAAVILLLTAAYRVYRRRL